MCLPLREHCVRGREREKVSSLRLSNSEDKNEILERASVNNRAGEEKYFTFCFDCLEDVRKTVL